MISPRLLSARPFLPKLPTSVLGRKRQRGGDAGGGSGMLTFARLPGLSMNGLFNLYFTNECLEFVEEC